MRRERSLVCADGLSVGWWRREFALLRAAPASTGFGILKQPRQTRSLVTNRADMVKPTKRRAAPRSACVCNKSFCSSFCPPKIYGKSPKTTPEVPSPQPRLSTSARVGAEAPKPGRFLAASTPVQEAAGSRDRVPGTVVPGMLVPMPPSRRSHAREAALRAGRQELGRNGLCSHRALREEELQSLSL